MCIFWALVVVYIVQLISCGELYCTALVELGMFKMKNSCKKVQK